MLENICQDVLGNICQPVLAFSSNFFGAITHRGGRDARVPVRRRFAANLCGITRGKTRSYNANVFWFWAIEIPVRVGDPVVGLRRRYSPRKPGGRLPTLRCLITFHDPTVGEYADAFRVPFRRRQATVANVTRMHFIDVFKVIC
jgi:hypothetical protein